LEYDQIMPPKKILRSFVFLLLFPLVLSCSKEIGWGILLWSLDDPYIPSGTVLPIYVRSNIEESWIAGIPEEYRSGDKAMAEIPLPHLELHKSRGAAMRRAEAFSEYAISYAEVLQDGLPIRDQPENGAKRVYRLKEREIIKILEKVEGVSAISTAGSPLQGDWFRVLTESGSAGYCFSNRLRIFEHSSGPVIAAKPEIITGEDPYLDLVLSRIWYPEIYKAMINSGVLDLDALSKHWGFKPGVDTGKARVLLPDAVLDFSYKKIIRTAERTWDFEGSPLRITLESETGLLVQYDDENGTHAIPFVTLPVSADIVINRELERRQALYQELFVRGPVYYSANYGTLTLAFDMHLRWEEMNLPEEMAPPSALGSGIIDMGIYLSPALAERYTGAFTLKLDRVSGEPARLTFLYNLDNQGLRLEFVPRENVNRSAVTRRDDSALVIYLSAG
jgi:hypothetical protein